MLDGVERAVTEIAAGRPVVVVDDEDRENEGDLVMAADAVTPEWMGFMVRWTSGLVCVPMTGPALDRLGLPLMVERNEESLRTAYTVTVDARTGITTGISAADRARTARLLADPSSTAHDLVRPGHLLPLRARDGGVLERRGHTEAAVDLVRLAGREPAGVLAELVHDDGSMMRAVASRAFADEHGLAMISIADLVRYRRRHETSVDRVATTRLPTRHGLLTAHGYADRLDGSEHVALVAGDVTVDEPVLVRVHSECLTGDVLGSLRCDCGPQLGAALDRVVAAGRGVVVYLRGHEGRGIGLLAKLQAYALQDAGLDTVDANLELGLPADAREYDAAAQILDDLGVRRARLLTNNPAKVVGLRRHGVEVVEQVPLAAGLGPENVRYLTTKRDRMGHDIPGLEVKA
ncbi:MAG: bifunctional 3,4-dihydroxy-2-butanone-4-phosphate synthase/GTP cyclohydrolase II [Actinomycetes bacterium]